MTVQEIVLHAANRPPVTFQGRVIAQAEGPADDLRLLGRHHAITVYETEAADLHLAIEFKTECEHEEPRCDVELKITPEELAEVLLFYDATEYLNRKQLQHRYEVETAQFMKRIHHQYDDLCRSVERQMHGYQPTVPVGVPQQDEESNQPGWRSWIPFGKPR